MVQIARADLSSVLYVARNMRESDRHEIFATRWTDDIDSLALEIIQSWGPIAYTAFTRDGVPAAVFGATALWPGVWAAWMFATDRFLEVGKRVTRFALRGILPAMLEAGCHRIEARSAASHHEAHRWMRVLGAKRGPELRQFGRDKSDFVLFVWEF